MIRLFILIALVSTALACAPSSAPAPGSAPSGGGGGGEAATTTAAASGRRRREAGSGCARQILEWQVQVLPALSFRDYLEQPKEETAANAGIHT
uniref:Secreted protein n=1 Tax=Angiostrongylus cantonensis TaxID=6313 RepID=A0A0K0DF61_ANGCA